MSLDSSLNNKLRLLSESRKFYQLYKPALASLREQEAQITFALENLAAAKHKLRNAELDKEALFYFYIPGTIQEVREHTEKLDKNLRDCLEKVEKNNIAVTRLLSDRRYIQSKNTVEGYKEKLEYYTSLNLFR